MNDAKTTQATAKSGKPSFPDCRIWKWVALLVILLLCSVSAALLICPFFGFFTPINTNPEESDRYLLILPTVVVLAGIVCLFFLVLKLLSIVGTSLKAEEEARITILVEQNRQQLLDSSRIDALSQAVENLKKKCEEAKENKGDCEAKLAEAHNEYMKEKIDYQKDIIDKLLQNRL